MVQFLYAPVKVVDSTVLAKQRLLIFCNEVCGSFELSVEHGCLS